MRAEDFKLKAILLEQELNNTLPRWIKDSGVTFFKTRFEAQGWRDTGFTKWKDRKHKDKKRPLFSHQPKSK